MASKARIAVLGAGGHTGRFVMDVVAEEGAVAVPVTRSGRFAQRGGKERGCPVLDFSDPSRLDRALADADAVINCAGPFFDTAEPAAEAALRRGIPYVDVTAEQVTVQRLFERLDGRAQATGITMVPAMAFYGGLADLLVTALVDSANPVEDIQIAIALDSWQPTQGTRLTGARNTYPRQLVRGGKLDPVPASLPASSWKFPEPFGEQPVACVPLAEIILLARHINADSITSYMNQRPLDDLADPRTPAPVSADSRGRSSQRFVVDVRLCGRGASRRGIASGRDIYAVTAPLAVRACLHLLANASAKGGVFSPGEILPARSFLSALAGNIDIDLEALPLAEAGGR